MASDAVRFWNDCVRRTYTLAEAQLALAGRVLHPVEPGAVDYLVTDDGIVIRLPPGRAGVDGGALQAVGLCVDRDYFLPPGIQPRPVSGPLLLNSVLLSSDASTVLNSMRAVGMSPVELFVDHELYTIVYGSAILLEFLPNSDWTADPADSRLAMIQFNFGPAYTGAAPPVLTAGR